MARRRSGGAPGLIDRVRWGNLGRLAAVIAACLLFVAAPRGGGPEVPAAVAVEEPLRSRSPEIGERLGPETAGSLLGEGSGREQEPRGRRKGGRGRSGNGGGNENGDGGRNENGNREQSRAAQAQPATPPAAHTDPIAPVAPAPPAPAPAPPPPRRSTGEFL